MIDHALLRIFFEAALRSAVVPSSDSSSLTVCSQRGSSSVFSRSSRAAVPPAHGEFCDGGGAPIGYTASTAATKSFALTAPLSSNPAEGLLGSRLTPSPSPPPFVLRVSRRPCHPATSRRGSRPASWLAPRSLLSSRGAAPPAGPIASAVRYRRAVNAGWPKQPPPAASVPDCSLPC